MRYAVMRYAIKLYYISMVAMNPEREAVALAPLHLHCAQSTLRIAGLQPAGLQCKCRL